MSDINNIHTTNNQTATVTAHPSFDEHYKVVFTQLSNTDKEKANEIAQINSQLEDYQKQLKKIADIPDVDTRKATIQALSETFARNLHRLYVGEFFSKSKVTKTANKLAISEIIENATDKEHPVELPTLKPLPLPQPKLAEANETVEAVNALEVVEYSEELKALKPEHFKSLTSMILSLVDSLTHHSKLKTPLPTSAENALKAIIQFAGGRSCFNASNGEIAGSVNRDKKTFKTWLTALFNWQVENDVNFVSRVENENPRAKTDWTVSALDILSDSANYLVQNDINVNLYRIASNVANLDAGQQLQIEPEKLKIVQKLNEQTIQAIKQLPPVTDQVRQAVQATALLNQKRAEEKEAEKLQIAKLDAEHKQPIEEKLTEALTILQSEGAPKEAKKEAVHQMIVSEVQLAKIETKSADADQLTANHTALQFAQKIRDDVMRMKGFYDKSDKETQEQIQNIFKLFPQVLTAKIPPTSAEIDKAKEEADAKARAEAEAKTKTPTEEKES